MSHPPAFGIMAEFTEGDALTGAVRAARAAGWTRLEAYSPYPLPEAAEALGVSAAPVGYIALAAGAVGAAISAGAAWYVSVHLYPVNVGGRPPNAWPVFMPTTYLVGILWACAAALIGMLTLNRLPRLNHPAFFARGFNRATEDRFFLFLSVEDPLYEADEASHFLRSLSPLRVTEVRST
ncbi:DUF3341 domain-containing protein [Roseomonas sp. SSH11]|uniref:DUF3341 domain-containing protein n=1 Tax=Pararoseomonas baculiformis TaxID=2820812 RepID=A0ABS4ABQ8_9PROT|nr:DUF3341 domain-containing protein [Pararoseomonas baculiformis]MBP0444433.1 DUF3341 domain-containing protein [Pararoseomonas baculiformis]